MVIDLEEIHVQLVFVRKAGDYRRESDRDMDASRPDEEKGIDTFVEVNHSAFLVEAIFLVEKESGAGYIVSRMVSHGVRERQEGFRCVDHLADAHTVPLEATWF